jgi:D-lactate dehydrogenase (cytochrome)
MLNPDDPKEFGAVTQLSERLVERALKFGGTCSGEHGVGIGKLKYLAAEHGAALEVMRSIKQAIDPNNLMNPGKLIPEV